MTLTALAGPASSSSYKHIASLSPVIGSVGKCPHGPVSTLGFWSFLGPIEVPLLLSADRDDADPGAIRLDWSGQSNAFIVYRSSSPEHVVAPGNILTITGSCEHVDSTPSPAQLYFYRVTPSGFRALDPETP